MKRINIQKRILLLKRICVSVAVIGIFLLLGTAGSSDLDRLSFTDILLQSILGFSFVIVGVKGAIVCSKQYKRRKLVLLQHPTTLSHTPAA